MKRQLKRAPLLAIITLLLSFGSPRYMQNDRDYDRARDDNQAVLGERRADSRNRGALWISADDILIVHTPTGRGINLYGATVAYDNRKT